MKWSKTGGVAVVAIAAFVLGIWALSLWKRPRDDGKAAQPEPSTAADFWTRGQQRRRENQPDGALDDMKKLLALDPAASRAWAVIAEISLEKEDFKGAETAYGEVIRLRPKEAAALVNRGLLRLRLGAKTEGLADFDRAVEADPLSVEARMTRAVHLQYDKKFAEAIRDYSEVLKLHPDQVDALVARGLANQYSGNLDSAEKDLRQAEKLRDNSFDIQANLALLLKQKGDGKGSEAAFQKAIKMVPAREANLRKNLEEVAAPKK